jgi:tetratricopeptide (TPR) repeat protein
LALTLGEVEFQSGNTEAALRFAREALAADRVLSKEDGVVFDLCNIAAYLVDLKRYDDAAEAAAEALSLATERGVDFAGLLALQHSAAIAALKDGSQAGEPQRLAARILGFVDRQFADAGFRRYFTEQKEYDSATSALCQALGVNDLTNEREAGAAWSMDRAIAAARQIISAAQTAPAEQ